jgi:hypothetical protein
LFARIDAKSSPRCKLSGRYSDRGYCSSKARPPPPSLKSEIAISEYDVFTVDA